jgi:hypothetical protein
VAKGVSRNVEATSLTLLLLAGMAFVAALVGAAVWRAVRRNADRDEVDESGRPQRREG